MAASTIDNIIMIIPCLWTSLFGLVSRYIPNIIPNNGRNTEQMYPRTMAVVCLSGFNKLPQFVHATFPKGIVDPHFGQMVPEILFCWVFVDEASPVCEAPHPEQNLVPSFNSLPQLLQNGIFLTLRF